MAVTNGQCGPHPLPEPVTWESVLERLQYLSELGRQMRGTPADKIQAMIGCVELVRRDLQQLEKETS
jgi:hypothetical protein